MIEDSLLAKHSQELKNAIAAMNHNIETIKVFMSSQCLQNELFLENQKSLREEIEIIQKRLKAIECSFPSAFLKDWKNHE